MNMKMNSDVLICDILILIWFSFMTFKLFQIVCLSFLYNLAMSF